MTRAKRDREGSVKAVAIFEAVKGATVLLAGMGVLSLANDRVRDFFDEAVAHAYLNPSKHMPHSIVEAALNPTDRELMAYAGAAFLYALMRLAEAFGLWRRQEWAQWFGLSTGLMYIPFELHSLINKPGWLGASLLFVNLLVVAVLFRSVKRRHPTHVEPA